jgi:hypothetical protein
MYIQRKEEREKKEIKKGRRKERKTQINKQTTT